mgnify:CR=1 FL=1
MSAVGAPAAAGAAVRLGAGRWRRRSDEQRVAAGVEDPLLTACPWTSDGRPLNSHHY